MTVSKAPRFPTVVSCQNPACSRDRMDPSVYEVPIPKGEGENIHVRVEARWPAFAVACPHCGHCSVFMPPDFAGMMKRLREK